MNPPLSRSRSVLSTTRRPRRDLLQRVREAKPAMVETWRRLQVHKWPILAITALVSVLSTVLVETNKSKVMSVGRLSRLINNEPASQSTCG